MKRLVILIFTSFFIMNIATALDARQDGCLITHKDSDSESLQSVFEKTKKRIEESVQLILPREETLGLLEELTQFEFGRFLLQNGGGLNGYWTAYFILYGLEQEFSNSLEEWIMQRIPIGLATRERFKIFQRETGKHIYSGMKLASIPCGLMDDLLLLDFEGLIDISFDGIDLDEASLVLAHENAQKQGVESNCLFLKKNAWELEIDSKYDLITSSGLNVYEKDDAKVTELYRNFYTALRPGGILITSFFTPPPLLDPNSPWRNVNLDDMKKQKAIFGDILQAKWATFRTEAFTKYQLEIVGFTVLEFIYDSQRMFPTVIARKD